MTAKLFIQAITKYIEGIVAARLLIFLPAGTPSFFNGLLFHKKAKKPPKF